jgi:hypothetical protein
MGRDGIAGLAILAGSLGLLWATLSIQGNPLVPVSPALYPRLVLGLTALFSLVLLVQDLRAHRVRAPSATASHSRYAMVVVMFAIFAAYVFALPWFGFRLATIAFVAVMQVALEPARTPRRWVVVGVIAVVTSLAAYYTFEEYLQVLLPRGLWTGF